MSAAESPVTASRRLALGVRAPKRVRAWGGDVGRAAVAFWKDNCPGMAGMIAFFGFLSAVPLLLLLLAFMGQVLGGLISPQDVRRLFESVVPGLSQKQFLHTYWDPVRHSKVATTALGVVSLLFGAMGLHDSVDWAIGRIWRSREGRPFWLGKLRGLGVILWVTAFAILSFVLSAIWASALNITHAPGGIAALMTALIPSTILDTAIFTSLYMLTPTTRVRLRPALAGGVVGACMWELTKIGFAWWVLQVGTYNRVYGPLAATVIVMLWMWISAMIFLFGSALAFSIQCRMAGQQPAPESWWYDA